MLNRLDPAKFTKLVKSFDFVKLMKETDTLELSNLILIKVILE